MTDEPVSEWKYADCPTTSVSTEINGSVADVWALVGDVEMPVRFSTEVQGVDWLDGATGPALGARFVGRNQHQAIGEWQVECTITGYEPERLLEWSTGEPGHPSAVWAFEVVDSDGSVTLTQRFQMGPAPSGLTPAIEAMPDKESKIIARRLAEHATNMQANLDGVKALIEAGAAEPAGS